MLYDNVNNMSRPLPSHQWRSVARGAVPVALAAILVAGCHESADRVRFAAPVTLTASTGVGTAPMFAVAPSGTEAVAWVSAPDGGTDGRLYVSVGGAPPTELRDSLGPIEAHGEAPPKLAYGRDGRLYALYVVGKEVPTARFPLAALRFVRSEDGGRRWSAPVTVTDDGVFGAHNFHALHVADDGTIYASWLGGESGKSAAWVTRSTDGGASWAPRVRVDLGEACPCCRTALGTGPDGVVYLAWRHIFPGNVRDIVVARSDDRGATWSAPQRVHADDWVVDGCPHAGPALQVDAAGRVHIAWWTGKEKAAGVWYARSDDGGRQFGAPVALGVADFSRPAHVQLALGPDSLVAVVWDDGTRMTPQVVWRASWDGGRTFGPAQRLSAPERAAGFPVLAVAAPTVAVAWSEQSAAPAEADHQAKPASGAGGKLHPVGDAIVVVRRGNL